MRTKEIMDLLEAFAPPELACEYDNVGLLAGDPEKEVKSIYISLDADDSAVEAAAEGGFDLLLTHHPLIFKPLKSINEDRFIGRRLRRLIRSDVNYYALHTNFDMAKGGMADLAAAMIGLGQSKPLQPAVGSGMDGLGIGRVGELKEEMTLEELCQLVKSAFALPNVNVYAAGSGQEKIRRAAISPGSGSSVLKDAVRTGASVLITGDIGHHEGIDTAASGVTVIDAGHYGLEHIFIPFMEAFLKKNLPGLAVCAAPMHPPCHIM